MIRTFVYEFSFPFLLIPFSSFLSVKSPCPPQAGWQSVKPG